MLNSVFTNQGEPGNITFAALFIVLIVAIVLGILTSMVFSFRIRHSKSFALTLALMPMAVSIVIILVNGRIGTGIAVAGAFTLVRFRSIPGTTREIAAIFTTMVIGLALGTGYIGIAVLFFVLTALMTIILTVIGFGGAAIQKKQLKITLPENLDYAGLFDEVFEKYNVKYKMSRVRTVTMGTLFEITYDIVLPGEEIPKAFIDDIRTKNGNLNIVVCDYLETETL